MKKPHSNVEDGPGVTEHQKPNSQSLYSKSPCNEVPTIWRTFSAAGRMQSLLIEVDQAAIISMVDEF